MTTTTLDLAHYSMQYSDTHREHLHDAKVMYGRDYHWLTGTEAGEEPLKRVLRVQANAHGYTFVEFKSNWISVKKSLIVPGSLLKGKITVINNDLVFGRGHDTAILWNSFEIKELGRIAVLASHYPTMGDPAAPKAKQKNLRWTKKIADAISDVANDKGAGRGLVFYGGDQNIVDRTSDTFFGGPLTSAWDELGKYENTGHGNIDVIASYDKDHRVKAKYVRALDDRELPLFGDHFPVEAGYDVERLNS